VRVLGPSGIPDGERIVDGVRRFIDPKELDENAALDFKGERYAAEVGSLD
jgi:hypothetical protein